MSENSALSELAKKLEQSKKQELDQIKKIEQESMSELAKSLRTSLKTELSSIKDDILEMQKSVNKNNKTLAENSKDYSEKITQNFQSMSQELTKLKAKQWIIPTVMGLAIVLALALGTWGTTKYLSHQLQVITEKRAEIVKLEATVERGKKILGKYIVQAWGNHQLGAKKKPSVWQDTESGLWVIDLNPKEN